MIEKNIGKIMHDWAKDLFPICRSITGGGVRETLDYIANLVQNLTIYDVKSGTKVFDWVVPDEWTMRDAYISDESGQRVVDFKKNNLHIVGYSEPVDLWLNRDELDRYLYSLPSQPDAIPYVTSYYYRQWGFCLAHRQRQELEEGLYHVVVDSDIKPGVLNYAEVVIPGESKKEVLLSTYICHPSLANNELSGPVVTTALAQWIYSLKNRRYTYRIVFVPETIGSIAYLSRNISHLKKKVVAGFNITCIGDERCYSYLPSRSKDTLSDQVATHVLRNIDYKYKRYSWLDRGSDERQYCSPGIDLPIATIMRSKYGEYDVYHTSLDYLNLVTPKGLEGGFKALKKSIEVIEKNMILKVSVFCEPQLGKRGLYQTLSRVPSSDNVRIIMDLISYCDGSKTLLDIADIINQPFWELLPLSEKLIKEGLLLKVT